MTVTAPEAAAGVPAVVAVGAGAPVVVVAWVVVVDGAVDDGAAVVVVVDGAVVGAPVVSAPAGRETAGEETVSAAAAVVAGAPPVTAVDPAGDPTARPIRQVRAAPADASNPATMRRRSGSRADTAGMVRASPVRSALPVRRGARSGSRGGEVMRRGWLIVTAAVVLLAGCDGTAGTTTSMTGTTSTLAATTTFAGPVLVYFLNEPNYASGTEPSVQAVEREADGDPVRAALDGLFAGPTAEEREAGLALVASEATGYTDLSVTDGVARVRLTGGCNSGGATFTIANLIVPTLTQFDSILYVKIYDPEGATEDPTGRSSSIPFCLEP
jgi:hypothetical protein